ncbi:MAG: hypothetical protein M1831_001720 [Alyxoria varia]|nr:MAG: hypothetical protein M1831_001720 [Alyxoria varia]
MASSKDEDDDPVIKEYDVYISPFASPTPLHQPGSSIGDSNQALYWLKYEGIKRENAHCAANENAPIATRFKPNSSFLEVDLPITDFSAHDRRKSHAYGQTLKDTGGGLNFGISSGFSGSLGRMGGSGGVFTGREAASKRATTESKQHSDEVDLEESKEETGIEMRHTTVGSLVSRPKENQAHYMAGIFCGNQLHLTPIAGTAELRTQFPHIDAASARGRARSTPQRGRGLRGGRGEGTTSRALRSVHMTQQRQNPFDLSKRSALENNTKALLAQAAYEEWMPLKCHDENSEKTSDAICGPLLYYESEGDNSELISVKTYERYLDKISGGRAYNLYSRKKLDLSDTPSEDQSDDGSDEHGSVVEMDVDDQPPSDAQQPKGSIPENPRLKANADLDAPEEQSSPSKKKRTTAPSTGKNESQNGKKLAAREGSFDEEERNADYVVEKEGTTNPMAEDGEESMPVSKRGGRGRGRGGRGRGRGKKA